MPQYKFKEMIESETRNKCYFKNCCTSESYTAVFVRIGYETKCVKKPLCDRHAESLGHNISFGGSDIFTFTRDDE